MFPETYDDESVQAARVICATCPVQEPCLVSAVVNRERDGIWAGVPAGHRGTTTDLVALLATQSPGSGTRRPGTRKTSSRPYRGVKKVPSGRYAAIISVDGRRIRLGTFGKAEKAARVYDDAAQQLWGDAAVLNFPG